MQHFNLQTQSHLLQNLKEPDRFIEIYNRLADDMTQLEQNKKGSLLSQSYQNFNVDDLLDSKARLDGIFIGINDKYKEYPDAQVLLTEILVILDRHMKVRYSIEFKERS